MFLVAITEELVSGVCAGVFVFVRLGTVSLQCLRHLTFPSKMWTFVFETRKWRMSASSQRMSPVDFAYWYSCVSNSVILCKSFTWDFYVRSIPYFCTALYVGVNILWIIAFVFMTIWWISLCGGLKLSILLSFILLISYFTWYVFISRSRSVRHDVFAYSHLLSCGQDSSWGLLYKIVIEDVRGCFHHSRVHKDRKIPNEPKQKTPVIKIDNLQNWFAV